MWDVNLLALTAVRAGKGRSGDSIGQSYCWNM